MELEQIAASWLQNMGDAEARAMARFLIDTFGVKDPVSLDGLLKRITK